MAYMYVKSKLCYKFIVGVKKHFLNKCYVNFFRKVVSLLTLVWAISIFPPKDLEKYGHSKYACAVFFKIFPAVLLVSNCCLKDFIFPPKDLEKIRALKIRMRRFFNFFSAYDLKKWSIIKSIFAFCSTRYCLVVIVNKVNKHYTM